MGQYYKFINRTRQEESQISLPFNFGLPYAKSLEHYDEKEVEAMLMNRIISNTNCVRIDHLFHFTTIGMITKNQSC